MIYTSDGWRKDKLLVARLVAKGKVKEARELLNTIHMVDDKPSTVEHYVNGVLFAFDILGAGK